MRPCVCRCGGVALTHSLAVCVACVVAVPVINAEDALVVMRSRVSGLATVVESRGGEPAPVVSANQPGEAPGLEFLREHGHLFGIRDPRTELHLQRSFVGLLNQRHSTYRQLYHGVPVYGAAIKVHQDRDGRVVIANGDFFPVPDSLSVTPALRREEASAIALAGTAGTDLRVVSCELVIVDPGWYGDPPRGARLAYEVHLAIADGTGVEGLFIDAHDGEVLDRWPLVLYDRDRTIYDGQGSTDLPGTVARSEGWPPVGPTDDPVAHDINAVYDYAGDVYAFYSNAFGRDSLDGGGLPIVATVNSLAAETYGMQCPTAFYSTIRRQAVFCLGRVPDDCVAHELQHGITGFASGLVYQNQGAMLDESFSYVFGETVDLFNSGSEVADRVSGPPPSSDYGSSHGIDWPNWRRSRCSPPPHYPDGVRWLANEDRVEQEGAVLDYWDPTCFGHPDRTNSPLFSCSEVPHLGSEVPNHAYAMVVDGQSFNGVTVRGIGLFKAVAVWYRALTVYLTPGSDFEDAAWALKRAATDLVGTYPNNPRTGEPLAEPFTADDAEQVALALHAVEMDVRAPCGWAYEVLDSAQTPWCQTPVTVFKEDFETGLEGWTVSNSGLATPYDWRVTEPGEVLPLAHPGRAAFCADPMTPCEMPGETGTHTLTSPTIQMPPGVDFPVLEFTHFVATEWGYDGGIVEIRVADGDWLTLPPERFFFNRYNLALVSTAQDNTNPLAGKPAFSGAGGGWGTSLVDLSGLAASGESIQLRFVLGKDWCVGVSKWGGWYLDNIRVYDCQGSEDCNDNNVPDDFETAGGGRRDVIASHPTSHDAGYPSDAEPAAATVEVQAQRLFLMVSKTVRALRLWGYYTSGGTQILDDFTVVVHEEDPASGLPGPVISTEVSVAYERQRTGLAAGGLFDEWEITLHLAEPVTLAPGTYWIEVFDRSSGDDATFMWSTSEASPTRELDAATASQAPGQSWRATGAFDMAIEVESDFVGADCDHNQVPDSCDIATGRLSDRDGNGVPDVCQLRRARARVCPVSARASGE